MEQGLYSDFSLLYKLFCCCTWNKVWHRAAAYLLNELMTKRNASMKKDST